MSKLLRKLFIKNYDNVRDPKVREKHGYLASIVGIISNLLLAGLKLTIGCLIFSMSIITDALNNLTDMASSIVSLFGFKLASKPADKKHPFGHERIEYIASLIISFIIIMVAVILGYTSVIKIINNEVTDYSNNAQNIATFIILGAAIIIKLWQGLFYKSIAKAIDSLPLKASGQDSINDTISTSVVLIATIIEFCLRQYNVHIDGYVGVALSLFIVIMGIKLLVESSNPLIGVSPDHDFVKKIVDDILKYDGVLGVHDIMCYSYGPTKTFMTAHVEVSYKDDILQAHDMIDNIEKEMSNKYKILLTIHMDPIVNDSRELEQIKEQLKTILSNIDNKNLITFHDLRMVKGTTHNNLIFDIVIPYECKLTDKEVINKINNEFKKINDNYFLVIHIDRNYID